MQLFFKIKKYFSHVTSLFVRSSWYINFSLITDVERRIANCSVVCQESSRLGIFTGCGTGKSDTEFTLFDTFRCGGLSRCMVIHLTSHYLWRKKLITFSGFRADFLIIFFLVLSNRPHQHIIYLSKPPCTYQLARKRVCC